MSIMGRRNLIKLGAAAGAYALTNRPGVATAGIEEPDASSNATAASKMGRSAAKAQASLWESPGPYAAKDFSGVLGMKGLSDVLITNHFKLYSGYVKNTNLLLDKLSRLASGPEYAELKRRMGFEFNGMRLHEYYFGNLGGAGVLAGDTALGAAIAASFGNFDAWKEDFIATGGMRGIGWAVLYADAPAGRLANFWITDHENGHPAGLHPLLVMDVWEHAYMTDYQLDRGAYMKAFLANADWTAAAARFQCAGRA